MKKVSDETYSLINNDIYDIEGDRWWHPDFSLNLIRTLYNPFRVNYAKKIINQLKVNPAKTKVLEVGCGGGIFIEDIAKMGLITTGIDPSEQSLNIAIQHAKENNLTIKYEKGIGENLPFQNNAFDIVFCCDVLEHVRDLPKVISEISRVLKNGGIFIYDTFNRTYFSKISIIKILQEWKRWAIMPPNLHVWKMFIKPDEIRFLLRKNQLDWKEHRGIKPDISYLKMLRYLHQRAVGELTYVEFGKKFRMVESKSTQIMYMGYAIKNNNSKNT
ncbi:MAG: bifunctional 2-polyprenyl-6-hydroxyphenol methylase/3-demethylubiquinol 3-O-methyltransferase UbiG [Bacteroidota bacterium]|nr:bifunctional 2-polyprenyl-6-hydroxyphenol methylase/3-demethylubiquinol 3-O-methyltransferase UbiG [Bacteroidota bacterium]